MVFQKHGRRLIETTTVRLVHINEILDTHFSTGLDYLSIDIEGGEYEVLCAMNLDKYRPPVMIVETWQAHLAKYNMKISELLESIAYHPFITLKPNVIFVTSDVARVLG